MKMATMVLMGLLAAAGRAPAQEAQAAQAAQADPLTAHARFMHEGMKRILLQSAERMPDDKYSFRPSDAVRTYGQILGHVADMQYMYCAALLGEKNPAPGFERKASTKGELIAALDVAHGYCSRVFAGMTDASGAQAVSFGPGRAPRLSLIGVNQMHSALHYGNLVTYMRLNGVVPPTSDPAFMAQSLR